MSLNLNTELGLINTTANSGIITLPATATSQGRVITFKDALGTFGVNSLTLNASGSDTFEDGSTSKALRENNGIIQVVASGTTWYVLTGTQQSIMNVSTLQVRNTSTQSISTANLLVSSLQYDAITPIFQQSSLVYYNSNVFAGSRVYPQTTLNRYTQGLIFNPNSIPNLSYWFDASVSSSMVLDSASTVLTWYSISTVSTGPSNIRNVLTMTGPTTSNRGLYAPNSLNGLGGVNLSTSFITTANLTNQAQNLYYFNNGYNNNSEFTSIVLINRLFGGPTPITPPIYLMLTGSSRTGVNAGGLEAFTYYGPNNTQLINGNTVLCNTPTIILTTRNSSRMELRTNGVSISANLNPFSFGTANFQFMFGTNSYNQFYSGNLHEFIQYQRALTSNEILELEGYVAWKWNILTSLPSTHPYRFVPPF